MKKVIALLLMLTMILLLSACGEGTPLEENPDASVSDVQASEPETAMPDSDFVLDCLTIEMDGKSLSLPFKWTEIESTVQSYYTEPPAEITYGDEHIGYYWQSRNGNGSQIDINVFNPTPETPIGVEESLVCRVRLHTIIDEMNKVDLILPDGITFGSTYDEVIQAYGMPTKEIKPNGVVSKTIYASEDETYMMELTYKNNEVSGCILEYNFK